MNTSFRPVKAALLAQLTGAAQLPFVANAVSGNTVLTAVSTMANLFVGLPVFGAGMPSGVTIAAIDAAGATVSLSDQINQTGTNVAFVTGFQTTSGRLQHWSQCAAQPALFLRRTGVLDEAFEDGLVRTTLEYEAWIYSNGGQDPDADPDDMLSSIEQLLRNALIASPYDDDEGRFTLRSAMAAIGQSPVYWCRIEGKSDISTGDQGPQAIARIPIRVTLP